MAETLIELVAKIKADSTGLEKGLSDAERKTETSSKKMAESLKKVGKAMTVSGAAITAAMGLMVKAAINEEINIKRLATTINNSGTAYDKVKDSLEAVIAATQRKTGVADDEQRDILNRLILVTNDYGKALALLPTVLDLAAAGEMDATTAATYLGKAFLELEDGAEEVSVRFGQATLQFKDMEDIQNRVRGAAENLANPLSVLKASISDMAGAIGSFLIPTIKDLVNRFGAVSAGVQNWIKLNPELVGQLVLSTAKLGLLLLTIGSLILILPKIVGFITMLTGLMGPWGWAILAVAGTVGYLVAELLGLSDVMAGIKGIMADVEKQMFILRAEQSLSAEEWAKIKEQGYLTEQQFINLAKAMKLSTEELYNQMVASKMLQVTMTSVGDTNIYLAQKTSETAEIIEGATQRVKEFNIALDGSKISLATATQKIGEVTYRTQLFTQAEIDAAKAAGAKIEMIEQQSKTMIEDAKATDVADKAIRNYSESSEALADQLAGIGSQIGGGTTPAPPTTPEKLAELRAHIVGLKETDNESEFLKFNALVIEQIKELLGRNPEMSVMEAIKRALGQPWTPATVPSFQSGGIVGQTGLAYLHAGETVVPSNEEIGGITINFTQPVFFDREDTMNRFVDMISKGIDRKQRIRFGGAYGGS